MSQLRFRLSFKFILIIVTLLALIFLAFGFVSVAVNVNTLSDNLRREIESFTELSSRPIGEAFLTYRDSGRIRITQVVQKYAELNLDVTNFMVVDTEGQMLFNQTQEAAEPVDSVMAATFTPIYIYNENGNINRAIIPYFEGSGVHRYTIVYDISDASIRQSATQQVLFIAGFSILGLIVSIVLMYGLINYHFINPIQSLSRQALAMSLGSVDTQIKIDRRDEVADLTKAVNQMARSLKDDIKKLEELDKLKSEFLIIASHNLRTPLTIIKGYLDEADSSSSLDEMRSLLEKMKYGSDQLSVFAEDMITIAELESGQSIGNRKDILATDFISEFSPEIAAQVKRHKLKYEEKIQPGDYRININKSLVRGAIWNLLDNAQKFTKEGGTVKLSVSADKDSVKIAVADTGIGIAPEEIPKLFTKFHRGTSVMVYDYEGTGIGLYSSYLVVKQHGGSIDVDSELGRGSTFTINLPREK